MVLRVKNLSVERGGYPLLKGVSFEVAAGNALILRGPNGIGKTSLLRSLAGLQPSVEGQLDFDQNECVFASHADGIKAALTVTENLKFWADVYGQELQKQVFEWFELTSLADRVAATLSAGQKRRLGLARLGVTGRKIFFLDEPTVSLDAESVQRFATFLIEQHLAQGGLAVIATHIDLNIDAPELQIAQFQAPADSHDPDGAFL